MLSDFERQEALRDEACDLPWRELPGGGRGRQGECDVRLPDNPDWRLTVLFDIDVEDFPLVELRLRPALVTPPPEGITVDLVRSIRLRPLHEAVRAWMALPPAVGPTMKIERTEFGTVKRTGRRGRADAFFAQWAAWYVEELAITANPIPPLSKRHNFSSGTVRYFLNEARRRELLTKAPPGRAGGRLTEKGMRLLDSMQTPNSGSSGVNE